MENIEQRVKKIVAEQLGVNEAEIKNESSFVDDLGADSLDTVELVMALEEEFETEIPDEEAEKITTVQQAIDYINAHSRRPERPAASVLRVQPRKSRVPPPSRRHRAGHRQPGREHRRRSLGRTSSPGRPGITRITRFDASRLPQPDRRRGEGLRRRARISPARKRAASTPSSTTAWRRRCRRCKDCGLDGDARERRAHRRASSARASAGCR